MVIKHTAVKSDGEILYATEWNANHDVEIIASMIKLNELHAEGTSNFAGPGEITVTHSLNLSNYMPTVIPSEDGAGAIGEIWITDVAVNSFVVRNSGIAVTGFSWVVHNRT